MSAADLSARVLSGRLAGSGLPVTRGQRLSIGPDFFHDLVLRDGAVEGAAAEVEIGPDGTVRVTATAGPVTLLGMPLAPGTAVQVPPFLPVRLGSVALAFGPADEARWAEAAALAAAEPAGDARDGVPATAPAGWRGPATHLVRRLRGGMAQLAASRSALWAAVALFLLVGAPPVAQGLVDLLKPGPASAEAGLHEAGFRAVRLQQSGDRLVATGLVNDEGAREQVKRLLVDRGVDAIIDIRTGPELARAAADVARMHGVAASARWESGILELRTVPLDPAQQAALVQAIRRDVRGVGTMRVIDDLDVPSRAPDITRISDATKRVATVVSGDPAYIRTVDGARYFAGAVLPSGHVLEAIEDGVVVLVRDGRTVRVAF